MMWSYGSYGMGAMWLVWFAIFAALLVVPFWRLLPQHGLPAPLALIAAIPIGALILLWIVAFKDRVGGIGS